MITQIVEYQRRLIEEQRTGYVRQLVTGTKSREEDVYARGILRGLELAEGLLSEVEDMARRTGLVE